MTREKIISLEGNDLNRVLAIEVMGFEEISEQQDLNRKQIASYLPGHGIITLYGNNYIARFNGKSIKWNPGENMSVAWELVRTVGDNFDNININVNNNGITEVNVIVWTTDEDGKEVLNEYEYASEFAAEAICKAILLAVLEK